MFQYPALAQRWVDVLWGMGQIWHVEGVVMELEPLHAEGKIKISSSGTGPW